MEIIIIAAMSENRVIGKDNALPWSLKEDMARFKKLTVGYPCIMGNKTWVSLSKRPLPRRPLPGRLNIIISRSLAIAVAPGPPVFFSLQDAIQRCAGHEKIFICGGASIYREALALADKIELTVIHREYEGDAFFPEIDGELWTETGADHFDGFSFISYSRNHERSNFSSACGGHGESLRRA